MSPMLLLAVVVCAIVLYLPGCVLARSLSVSRFASLVIVPILSVFLPTLEGIVLFLLGISCPAFISLSYRADASSNEILKQVISRFWYANLYRIGMTTALFVMSLAALGFVQLKQFIRKGYAKIWKPKENNRMLACISVRTTREWAS